MHRLLPTTQIMQRSLINDIVQQLIDLEEGDLWLDENFAKKLAFINESNAFIRPLPDLHSPAELLSHLTVWRRINIRRMNGEFVELSADDPDDWKTNEVLAPIGWDALLKDFHRSKQEVLALLQDKDDSYLETISPHLGKNFKYLLQGLIHHDLYHLGQLGLSIKYLQNRH